jgi:GT2 family glycosyltransferase
MHAHAGAADAAYNLARMPDQPVVSVVTVGWNHSHLLESFLASLERVLTPAWAERCELVVVDNASQDDTPARLAAWQRSAAGPRHKQVLRNQRNEGFAGGYNRGVCAARGRHLLLLNNDVVFEGAPFDACLRAAARHPQGLFGRTLVRRGRWGVLHGRSLHYLEGWCLFATREVVRALGQYEQGELRGLFDERFQPAFYEDVDLSLRAHLQGLVLHELRLPLRHLGSRTVRQTPGFAYMEVLLRNQERFQAKWAHLHPDQIAAWSQAPRGSRAGSTGTAAALATLLARLTPS